MQFCCPSCGRDEEILLDRTPCCLVCNVEMTAASDYSNVWMSPYTALIRMQTIWDTYGGERARTDRLFQNNREAWATGVLGLALSRLNRDEWWIEVETRERTPDTKLHHIDQSSGHNVIQTRSIEVVDWEENVYDIMEVIRKKCRRAYPGHFLLVVNARHGGKTIYGAQIADAMKKIRSPFLEVWVVGGIGPRHLTALRVSPSYVEVDLPSEELDIANRQKRFVKRRLRGTTPGFYDLGMAYLPIPR
jgi:hypothetical protein